MRHSPVNLDLKRSRSKGPPCPYCGIESRVYKGSELYKAAARRASTLEHQKFCACIECRAWAPVLTNHSGGIDYDKEQRAKVQGTLADGPTRQLRKRAYALQAGLIKYINEEVIIRPSGHPRAAMYGSYAASRGKHLLAEMYRSDYSALLPQLNLLDRESCEEYIEWMRYTRNRLEEGAKQVSE